MDLGFNLAQSNRDLKDLTSRQNFGDTSGLLCKNDLIPCHMETQDQRVITKTDFLNALLMEIVATGLRFRLRHS